MPHDHAHCDHHHAPVAGHQRAFMLGIFLNAVFVAIEVFWGLKAGSVALLADAAHNASDVLALLLAWGALNLAQRRPSQRFTYGMGSTSILAALTNAVVLLVILGGLAWESFERFSNPVVPAGKVVMIVAAVGVLINGFTAWLFMRSGDKDINIRGAYLHMAADAAISLGVVVSGAIVLFTGLAWVDPATGLIIAAIIIVMTWGLLKESALMAMQAVPSHIDVVAVKEYLTTLPNVKAVHDLHIWAMSTRQTAATVHLVLQGKHPGDAFLQKVTAHMVDKFHIQHVTIQIELGDTSADCNLADGHVI